MYQSANNEFTPSNWLISILAHWLIILFPSFNLILVAKQVVDVVEPV
jgi:hypothetical protein